MRNKVSLCMIVKNEEKYLPQCLNSIKDIVDEIIIVDTGSSDNTVIIAESFGAKVYYFQWNQSFSEARNVSLKYATKDWILIMDADDEFCREDIQKFKELINSTLDENFLYYFETLNYCGSFVDSTNISVNLNPRLFKNNYGFHYEGRVHNQLVNSVHSFQDVTQGIRIYHYGYLDESIKSKDKRNRNISLLEEQLRNNPNDSYAHFNIGNEYVALNDMKKSLEHYYKAYENFKPNLGYGYLLFIRIVVANYSIEQYDEALKYADIGIQYYPRATDLVYLKAKVYEATKRPSMAVRALEKCIEMGEAPSELKFLYGTGSFKAYYDLGNIHMQLRDYELAYNYYVETIRHKPDFYLPLYRIAHILKEENKQIDELKGILENFFDDFPRSYPFLADILYSEGYYEAALEYVKKGEDQGITSESITILKNKALVRTTSFEECIRIEPFTEESPYYFYLFMCKAVSALLMNKKEHALSILSSFDYDRLSDYNKKMLQVYTQFMKLCNKEVPTVLCEDENEREYTAIIFELCEIPLINKMFDEFEVSLNLLNLISDKTVLLQLGKLYYNQGYIDMAKKEIIRSIKLFDIYDQEALDILMAK